MRNLPFREGSFAGVWCIAALLHVPKEDAPATLADMRRVLRHAGYFALSLQEGEGEEWNAGYVDGVVRFFARYHAPEIAALLADAGFPHPPARAGACRPLVAALPTRACGLGHTESMSLTVTTAE